MRRPVEATQEMIDLLAEQARLFEEKFGYPPDPDDPVFFDPDFDTPVEMNPEKMRARLEEMIVGLDPAMKGQFRMAWDSDMTLEQVSQRAEVERRMSRIRRA